MRGGDRAGVSQGEGLARLAGLGAGFALAYLLLGLLALALAPGRGEYAALWPASGLYLGAALLARPRTWPALAAGALAAAVALAVRLGYPPLAGLGMAAGDTILALGGAWVLRRILPSRPRLAAVPATLRFLLVGVVAGPAASASVGFAGLVAAGTPDPWWAVWLHFWVAAAVGVLLVAPSMVAGADALAERSGAVGPRRVAEAVGLAVALVAASYFVFGVRDDNTPDQYLLVPPVIYAALRFEMPGAAAAMALVGILGSWGTSLGLGEFVHEADARTAMTRLQVFLGVAGAVVLLFSAALAERKRAALALAESARRNRLLGFAVDQASDPTAVLDGEGRVVDANEAMARWAGEARGALLGRPFGEVHGGPGDERWRDLLGAARSGEEVRAEVSRFGGTGEARTVEWSVGRLAFEGRDHYVVTARDVTDRRRAETAIRLAGMGTLAAGVAHEINNPLSFVLANLVHLRESLSAGHVTPEQREDLAAAARDAEEGATRVSNIVRDLRAVSRPEGDTLRSIDVRTPLRAALSMAHNEIRHRARLVTEMGEVPLVLANEGRMTQVFLNLLVNAAQAIPEGRADANEIRVRTFTDGSGRAVVEVADTGSGMPPEVRARIFDPFYTTKAPGVGTGLGLSICHGIVSSLGGEIEVESEAGRGSTFRVALPPTSRRDEETPVEPARHEPAARRRILVIDDEPMVGSSVRRVLSGHDVEVHADPHAALATLERGGRFDLVLCDLMMPSITGMELQDRLVRADPRLGRRIVFMTGGAFTEGAAEFLRSCGRPWIAKPFQPADLRAAVAEALERADAAG